MQNHQITGRLKHPFTLGHTKDGEAYAYSVVVCEELVSQNGNLRLEPSYHSVKIWDPEAAKKAPEAFPKGATVDINGTISSYNSKHPDGHPRHSYSVNIHSIEAVSRETPHVNKFSCLCYLSDKPRFEKRNGVPFVSFNVGIEDEYSKKIWQRVSTSNPEFVEKAKVISKGDNLKIDGPLRTMTFFTGPNSKEETFELQPTSLSVMEKEMQKPMRETKLVTPQQLMESKQPAKSQQMQISEPSMI